VFTSEWISHSEPEIFNAKSVFLLLALSFLAYLVSPLSALEKEERKRLTLVFPLLIFVYVFLFQVSLLSVNPYVHYYQGPATFFAWKTNTGICCAFGAGFSCSVLRNRNVGSRIYGGIALAIFCLLALGYTMPLMMRQAITF
jgi:hypothetical protein